MPDPLPTAAPTPGLGSTLGDRAPREVCWRCRRPKSACFCADLPAIPSKTHVVFLQHPRERYVAIGTARLAHLALPNSEFHLGTHFEPGSPAAIALSQPGAALLFPADGAPDLATLATPPSTLVIIDGTWPQARKLLSRNPVIAALPRVSLIPSKPGNYRIRREPEENCVATIEAVVEALGILEGDATRFQPMLDAFARMIDLQIEKKATRTSPPRHKLPRIKKPLPAIPKILIERPDDLVLLYGEANAHPRDTVPPIDAELIQLVALRASTGERFATILAPRRPLAASTAQHLGLDEAAIRGGESVPDAMARFRAFLHPQDILCTWGHFVTDMLHDEGELPRPTVDLRLAVCRLIKGRPGGLQQAATVLGGEATPWDASRAGARIASLGSILALLQHRARNPLPREPRRSLKVAVPT